MYEDNSFSQKKYVETGEEKIEMAKAFTLSKNSFEPLTRLEITVFYWILQMLKIWGFSLPIIALPFISKASELKDL